MGIANVRGKFTEFEGTPEMKEELAASRARGSVKVASIDTGEGQRDDHLCSPDFFNAEEFPEITFEATRVEAIDDESSRVSGNLTMHGITREIRLEVVIQGTDTDPWGTRAPVWSSRDAQAQRLRHETSLSSNCPRSTSRRPISRILFQNTVCIQCST
jgi:polyisoprenoid-binding protein YceI